MRLVDHLTASVGPRAVRLKGRGAEYGRLVRLVLLSHTRWPGKPAHPPWPGNLRLSVETGLPVKYVELGIRALRDSGLIVTRVGRRVGARRAVGRVIDMGLHTQCKALVPDFLDVGSIWSTLRATVRRPGAERRPTPLVTAMVGAYMLACDAAGGEHIDRWAPLGCSMAQWRRFIGHRDNASWPRRVRELVELGFIRRDGREIMVAPPRVWHELAADSKAREAAEKLAPEAALTVGEAQPDSKPPKLPGQPMLRARPVARQSTKSTGTCAPPPLFVRKPP